MNLFENLRQLHKIEPDAEYARLSRAKILLEEPLEVVWYRRAALGLSELLQSGSAIALTGAALFLILGGFSFVRFLETAGGVNAQDLRAEAQAIDIQIQLTDLQYNSSAPRAGNKPAVKNVFQSAGVGTAGYATSTSSTLPQAGTEAESIDDALLQLSNP